MTRANCIGSVEPPTPRRGPCARDRAGHRRQRDFQDAEEVDAEWIEQAAEIAILVIGQALPVVLGHLADGDRLVIGVGDVVAELDGAVGVVDVAQAIEARIERADEVAFGIVDGRRQPALGVVAKLVVHRQLADVAPDRRHHVDEKQREQRRMPTAAVSTWRSGPSFGLKATANISQRTMRRGIDRQNSPSAVRCRRSRNIAVAKPR